MHSFDRPIIILSAPRSGSTLLFEVLSKSQSLHTIGGESHALIETIPKLNIAYRQFSSNALSADDIDDELRRQLQQRFSDELRDSKGQKPKTSSVRLLEKTPKNSLRVDFFNALFPDALFIYLVRDPKENISSIMQAWRSNKFVTYPNLPGWDKRHWSLLLPPNWQQLNQQPLHNIAAFQWQAANDAIMSQLQKLPAERWCMLSYDQLVSQPEQAVSALCEFTGIEFDPDLAALCRQPLPHSRYTITTPKADKWLDNYHDIEKVWSNIANTLGHINQHLSAHGQPVFEAQWQVYDVAPPLQPKADFAAVPRNSPCPCGSGKRFKQCHGALR